jgi:hypothetical protein
MATMLRFSASLQAADKTGSKEPAKSQFQRVAASNSITSSAV